MFYRNKFSNGRFSGNIGALQLRYCDSDLFSNAAQEKNWSSVLCLIYNTMTANMLLGHSTLCGNMQTYILYRTRWILYGHLVWWYISFCYDISYNRRYSDRRNCLLNFGIKNSSYFFRFLCQCLCLKFLTNNIFDRYLTQLDMTGTSSYYRGLLPHLHPIRHVCDRCAYICLRENSTYLFFYYKPLSYIPDLTMKCH